MRVFISWSGEQSRNVAEILSEWLPLVIQAIKPWASVSDIEKGEGWFSAIQQSLSDAKGMGVFCLTSENVSAPWLAFEAGALASHDRGRIATFLYDVDAEALKAPLALFQATRGLDRDDVLRLLGTINRRLDDPLSDALLERSFAAIWAALNAQLLGIPVSKTQSPKPTTEQVLHEILGVVRRLEKTSAGNDPLINMSLLRAALSSPPPIVTSSIKPSDSEKLMNLLSGKSKSEIEQIVEIIAGATADGFGRTVQDAITAATVIQSNSD